MSGDLETESSSIASSHAEKFRIRIFAVKVGKYGDSIMHHKFGGLMDMLIRKSWNILYAEVFGIGLSTTAHRTNLHETKSCTCAVVKYLAAH